MVRRLKYIYWICAAAIFSLIPGRASAAGLSCSAGSASGDLYDASPICSAGGGLDHIFTNVMCDFVTIINQVLGDVYCSIQFEMQDTIGAVITLYIAVFGVQILMGTVQLTVKEIMVRLLKIAGVWTFITQTYWAIGLAFIFFTSLAVYGATWVWGGVAAGGQDPHGLASTSLLPVFQFFDQVVYDAVIGPFTTANSEVIGFFFVMWYLIPSLFMLAAYWLWLNLTIMIRAFLTFLIAIAALGFLLALSPIFLSFMLFSVTYQFFESWLKYMMSYSIQVIVVFGITALWLAAAFLFIGFFDELSDVLFPYNSLWAESAPESDPVNTWGICPVDFTQDPWLGPQVACTDSSFDPTLDSPAGEEDRAELIPASRIAQEGEFVFYIVYRLLTLIIISFAFDALVRQAPYIAKSLAGPEYVPILGQGYGFSKYGLINKTPGWLKGKSQKGSVLSNLGLGKAAQAAMNQIKGGASSYYNNNMQDVLRTRLGIK